MASSVVGSHENGMAKKHGIATASGRSAGGDANRTFWSCQIVSVAAENQQFTVADLKDQQKTFRAAQSVQANLHLLKVDDVVRARCILDLAKAEIIGALVMEVFNLVSCRVENHRLAPHAAELSRTRKEHAPRPAIGAEVHRLTIEAPIARCRAGVVGTDVGANAAVKAAGGNTRRDIHDRRVLVPIFGVPTTGLKADLVDDLRIEQLVETP